MLRNVLQHKWVSCLIVTLITGRYNTGMKSRENIIWFPSSGKLRVGREMVTYFVADETHITIRSRGRSLGDHVTEKKHINQKQTQRKGNVGIRNPKLIVNIGK